MNMFLELVFAESVSCVKMNSQLFYQFQGPRWIFTIAVALGSFLIGQFSYPFCKGFRWDDASINMPFAAEETFPTWSLVPIAVAPVLLYGAVIFWFPLRKLKFAHSSDASPRLQLWLEWNTWALIQAQAFMFQIMFVDTMKLYAGRLRPDFLARLQSVGVAPQDIGQTVWYHCDLMSNPVIRQGRLSFPSGHSSTSFAAMVPLAAFLVYHLRPWFYGCVIRLVVCVLPLYVSFIVAISRTRDNRHHFADILAGSIIGTFAAIGAFWVNLRYSDQSGYFDVRLAREEEGLLPPDNNASVATFNSMATRDTAAIVERGA